MLRGAGDFFLSSETTGKSTEQLMVSLPHWCDRPWGTYGITLEKKLVTYQRLLERTLTYIAELVALSA